MRAPTTRPKNGRRLATHKPAFRSNKLKVRYAGMRWHLIQDRGTYLLIERRGCVQWINRALCQ